MLIEVCCRGVNSRLYELTRTPPFASGFYLASKPKVAHWTFQGANKRWLRDAISKRQPKADVEPSDSLGGDRVMPFRMNPLRKNRMGLSLNKGKYSESEARTGVDYAYHLGRRASRIERAALQNPNRPSYGHLVIQVEFLVFFASSVRCFQFLTPLRSSPTLPCSRCPPPSRSGETVALHRPCSVRA